MGDFWKRVGHKVVLESLNGLADLSVDTTITAIDDISRLASGTNAVNKAKNLLDDISEALTRIQKLSNKKLIEDSYGKPQKTLEEIHESIHIGKLIHRISKAKTALDEDKKIDINKIAKILRETN